MDEQQLIQAVRQHAMKHYDAGWDAVVEAWDDGDILEVVGQCRTAAGAIKAMAKGLGVKVAAAGYVVTTQDVDGTGQRSFKRLGAALDRFVDMAGVTAAAACGGAEVRAVLERGQSIVAVSMFGTRVTLRLVG